MPGDTVRIASFCHSVGIIRSKQRPRKIKIYGHDGQEFVFLLKGREDLRQDERAMQVGVSSYFIYNFSAAMFILVCHPCQ